LLKRLAQKDGFGFANFAGVQALLDDPVPRLTGPAAEWSQRIGTVAF
jgi:hypothetical protein